MAITFSTQIIETKFNNAYNNSIVEFESGILVSPPSKCTITISGIPFEITPIGLVFRFNFKEIVTVLINQNNFLDSVTQASDIVIDNVLKLTETVNFTITFDDASTDTINKTYSFLKSVQQISKENLPETTTPELLTIDTITVFKGYPFDITYSSTGTSTIINNTLLTSKDLSTANGNINRVFLSSGSSIMDNVTSFKLFSERILGLGGGVMYDNECSDIMLEPLLRTGVNSVSIISGSTVNDIEIKMIDNPCGVYLKWANDRGNFSEWLFSSVFQEFNNTSTRSLFNVDFSNLSNTVATVLNTGVESGLSFVLNYKNLSENEVLQLRSLLTSPRVELYNGEKNDELNSLSWQTVIVQNGQFLVSNTKRQTQNISLTINKNNFTQL